jgi:hypothetical protein
VAVFVHNTSSVSKIWIVTLISKKAAIFSPKIGEKLLKIVIITSVPCCP